jgi:hypothetical protein
MNIKEKRGEGKVNKRVYRIKAVIRQNLNGLSVGRLSFNNLFIALGTRLYVFRVL